MRVARARELVAEGDQATAAARIAQISRQAIYKTPQRRPPAAGPGRPGADDAAIVEIAKAHPTDGTRMVAAIASRQLGEPVNWKRAQRIMRTHRLLQPTRGLGRRRRPGYFRVRRPGRVVAYGHDQSLDSPARAGSTSTPSWIAAPENSSHGVSTCGAEPSRRWLVSTRR